MNQQQCSIEVVSPCVRRLTISVPAEVFTQAKKKQVQKLASTAKIDGFRPGKTPTSFIERFYKDSIHSEALATLLESSFDYAVRQEGLDPLSSPVFESVKTELDSPVEYVAKLEVYPDIPYPQLVGVALERLQVEIKETDVNQTIERMRRKQAQWQIVSRPADYGDRVSFDYVPEQGEPQKGHQLILEPDDLPPGFEGLKGSQVGTSLPVTLADHTGALITATLHVHQVEEALLADIVDSEFIKQFGLVEGDLGTLRNRVHQHMQKQLDQVLRDKLKAQIIEQLLVKNPISELPKTLIDKEYQRLMAVHQRQHSSSEKQPSEALPEHIRQQLNAQACRQVATGLLLRAFVTDQAMEPNPEQVKHRVIKLAETFQGGQTMVEYIYNSSLITDIESQVLEDQVIDKLSEQVQWHEKAVSYTTVMRSATAPSLPLDHHDETDDTA